jgi:hypothetical protein
MNAVESSQRHLFSHFGNVVKQQEFWSLHQVRESLDCRVPPKTHAAVNSVNFVNFIPASEACPTPSEYR